MEGGNVRECCHVCMDDVCLDVTKQESQREREFARALVCECAEVREREGRKEQKRDR